MANPFKENESIFYQDFSGAVALRGLALHLYNENWRVNLSKICGYLDDKHYQIAIDMIKHYRKNGENCPVFMKVCSKLQGAFWEERPRNEG
ncbi:MAG: hypothetical protein PSN46_09420 [Gammaproteobacteria bacterium]|nr:hypothetical protein [Gammaproteobacteria bacterium]